MNYSSLHVFLHKKITLNNRIKVLSNELSKIIESGNVLDVGCGSGEISDQIMKKNNRISIKGIDILVRPKTRIPVERYDGKYYPYLNNTFDSVIFVDVLHHTQDPYLLLKEAKRVSRRFIIIKDHNCNNRYHKKVLSFTDWFGNSQYGIHLELNFLSKSEWMQLFRKLDLKPLFYKQIKLYPRITKLIFWSEMDFIIKLEISKHE
jgi:ubiquinone/menaquinone biosynthesis C-methylase UbiE